MDASAALAAVIMTMNNRFVLLQATDHMIGLNLSGTARRCIGVLVFIPIILAVWFDSKKSQTSCLGFKTPAWVLGKFKGNKTDYFFGEIFVCTIDRHAVVPFGCLMGVLWQVV
ncbi:MAG: hypothetical protein CM15mP46_1560 [Alphaproteobacteria bacterium]|nr:MAG: hypothetical protein CM15mP46_1560 [Alphaproteobacteria bacterium]